MDCPPLKAFLHEKCADIDITDTKPDLLFLFFQRSVEKAGQTPDTGDDTDNNNSDNDDEAKKRHRERIAAMYEQLLLFLLKAMEKRLAIIGPLMQLQQQ